MAQHAGQCHDFTTWTVCPACYSIGVVKRRRLAVRVLSVLARSELQASFRPAAKVRAPFHAFSASLLLCLSLRQNLTNGGGEKDWVFSCRVWHLRAKPSESQYNLIDLQKIADDDAAALMRWAVGLFSKGRVDRRIELWFRLMRIDWGHGSDDGLPQVICVFADACGACGGMWRLAGARLTLAIAWKGVENLLKILAALAAAGMHAQVLLQSTTRQDKIATFDDLVEKTEACRDWRVFKIK